MIGIIASSKLKRDATQDEIKKGVSEKWLRSIIQTKLGDIGEEAKNAATEKFRMVQEAYDELNKQ